MVAKFKVGEKYQRHLPKGEEPWEDGEYIQCVYADDDNALMYAYENNEKLGEVEVYNQNEAQDFDQLQKPMGVFCRTMSHEGIKFTYDFGEAWGQRLNGTSEVCHIHSSMVHFAERGKGNGDRYHKERLAYFLEREPDTTTLLTCIVNRDNAAQRKIMKNNGWTVILYFSGSENQQLCFYAKKLRP